MGLIAYGWYDDPVATTPKHDPGLQVPCPLCEVPLDTEPRITISVCAMHSDRSLFFRAHKRCWNAASEAERVAIESEVVDAEVGSVS